jgi:hypothetical protein
MALGRLRPRILDPPLYQSMDSEKDRPKGYRTPAAGLAVIDTSGRPFLTR